VLESWRVGREREARARSDGALHRRGIGEGPLVVLIPGFLGTSSYWSHAFDELARDHRVISIDPLGFGRSPWPEIDYTLDEHLDALHRTIEQERSGDRITLVGHSFGALLAAYYAERHPEIVDRAVLLGLPIFHDERGARERIDSFGVLASMFVLDRRVAGAACHVLCAFRPVFAELVPYLDRRHSREGRGGRGDSHLAILRRHTSPRAALALCSRADPRARRAGSARPCAARRDHAARSCTRTRRTNGCVLVTVPGDHEGYLQQSQIIQDAIRSGMGSMASSALESRR
jgi:pimeloyl-ACP methyl ester carboxylesterase